MPESTDQQFDADMARRLKFNTQVTLRQQQEARARLLQRAAAETVHQPLKIELKPQAYGQSSVALPTASLRESLQTLRQYTGRALNFLIMDSKAFERANRPMRCYSYAPGRYAFMLIRVAA